MNITKNSKADGLILVIKGIQYICVFCVCIYTQQDDPHSLADDDGCGGGEMCIAHKELPHV